VNIRRINEHCPAKAGVPVCEAINRYALRLKLVLGLVLGGQSSSANAEGGLSPLHLRIMCEAGPATHWTQLASKLLGHLFRRRRQRKV